MLSDDPLWYKDAIIYELPVKAFFDSNDDGFGDFRGLLQKLDYLQSLGVTCLWLLPFYPSPQRDDGYDIAEYRSFHPDYGTMKDFKQFVRAAHARDLRVLTELVINHTSDQHPWFQRARRAPAGSRLREWYVWSDTDQTYAGTRVIFTDTEPSNWSWDPVAKAYYWHRFFSHQPDLNFANPRVVRSVIDIMRFWLDCGVDALRLDAIPYLCEREGTINENIPETHAILKHLRSALDERHKNRMLLAEANQWPEDVQYYFGEGDECHMAYHFPLMPRMYMAIAQEDRHPITDIMRQTPDIPNSCQWAIFLRNHDELTLEMVTNSERDYLWNTYAADRRARLNLGIRRRLAPLMENDRRKIELMNSLLMSLPGTPVIYYGDELGMGDNIFLGDRNGVRTPMQWTPDRNGGFSRGDPARLYLPPLMDPVYGYQSVNVEAQSRSPSSLLNWMRRLIAVRQSHQAVFGRGSLTFLYPTNRRILAFLRQYESETMLCVANLSRSAQAFTLDLSAFKGRVPVELLGRSVFPLVGEAGYELSLQGHSFYWFMVQDPHTLIGARPPMPEPAPEYVTLIFSESWQEFLRNRACGILLQDALPAYVPKQRWFRAKDAKVRSVSLTAHAEITLDRASWLFAVIETKFAGELKPQRYLLPMAVDWKAIQVQPPAVQSQTIAKTRKGHREGTLYDAVADDQFVLAIVEHFRRRSEFDMADAKLKFVPTTALASVPPPAEMVVRRLGAEQSNSSLLIEGYLVLKLYRELQPGKHPELELGRFLTEVGHFPNTPPLLGSVEIVSRSGQVTAAAVAHAFVRNQGDGWAYTLSYLGRFFDESAVLAPDELTARVPEAAHEVYLTQVRQLGLRTAEFHRALCPAEADRDFAPEPMTAADIAERVRYVRSEAKGAMAALRKARRGLAPAVTPMVDYLLEHQPAALERIGSNLSKLPTAVKIRIHGDYHLGQVLVAQNDFYIIDFEGEPRRPLADRRAKDSPLRDVAGMLRSFDYAALAAVEQLGQAHADRGNELQKLALAWRDAATASYLAAYKEAITGCPAYPDDTAAADGLLELFVLGKAFYEIRYELANRPTWLAIPLRGALRVLFPQYQT
ncbi:MAG TPA: maltose alpha-D-glucosyltransferase [Candidatus Angelobacter sp.]|nr:maltose alpha-D-glucosyltransferase [Candidatus Angelobacter sp.]